MGLREKYIILSGSGLSKARALFYIVDVNIKIRDVS